MLKIPHPSALIQQLSADTLKGLYNEDITNVDHYFRNSVFLKKIA